MVGELAGAEVGVWRLVDAGEAVAGGFATTEAGRGGGGPGLGFPKKPMSVDCFSLHDVSVPVDHATYFLTCLAGSATALAMALSVDC